MSIRFQSDLPYFKLPGKSTIKKFIGSIIIQEGFSCADITYRFCSDQEMIEANIQFLNHHYSTDIITFPLSEIGQPISADILISIDTVIRNANDLRVEFAVELYRVMIHGVLHLCGYGDKTKRQKELMRSKEDFYLSQRQV